MLVILEKFGYIGILILITVENIFPPMPSELILTFSGFMTNYTSFNIVLVIIFSCIGSLLGAFILYYIGSLVNIESNFFKKLGFKTNDIKKACYWFNKNGNITVLVCRFIPILRSLISIPAGISKMNALNFMVFTLIGSSIWNSSLVILGSYLGKNWSDVLLFMSNYSKIVVFILVIFFTVFVLKKLKK